MLRSRANIFESVRRVTQVNHSKDTPGVDHIRVTTPEERAALCRRLSQLDLHQVHPVRRGYIPKRKGSRPLGIPTTVDQCVQALVNNALEPYWEARFEGISYAFCPGRGCHDAVEKLFRLARTNTTRPWVLDANMEGAFNNIGHATLWSRYFCTGVASEVFTDLDNFMYARAQRYLRGGVIAISSPYLTT